MAPGPAAPSAAAARETRRRLFVYNGGFLTQGRLRRILHLAGWDIRVGRPGPGDWVGVWGDSPTAPRGRAVAARTGAPVLRVEDAFLRSVRPGRAGDPPIGLLLDRTGVHFDPSAPSDLETILATHPLDDPALIEHARVILDRIWRFDLSKYNLHGPEAPAPADRFVLLIDQTRNDASVRASGADRGTFLRMLARARADHPDATLVVRSHPETAQGLRAGHLGADDLDAGMILDTSPVSPWRLLRHATAVYAVSSQLGFEAILAGHRPVLFGQPFYAGWGLTDDPAPLPRRGRTLTPQQLAAAALILYPTWYDPCRDRLCSPDDALLQLAAEVRAHREDRAGWVATGMRLWKRGPLQKVFGGRLRFADDPARAMALSQSEGRRLMVWAGKTTPALDAAGAVRVEDGILRSRGLGAELVPPLSLVCDDLGIYYDPTRESRLERLIAAAVDLPPDARDRAARLIARIVALGLTKYNLGGAGLPDLPQGRRILVPGQVEDDASIRLGAGPVRSNADLLRAVRAARPDAVILFKPHPDVEAGLRPGAVPDAQTLADVVLPRTDPVAALSAVDEVWTMTSTLGFEALLRDVPVTCLGTPFYAGWGLTTDLGPVPDRRQARPDLVALAHAVLIDYPRYHDPVSGRPCPPEVALDRLATGDIPHPGAANRALSKLQGWFAGAAPLWRK